MTPLRSLLFAALLVVAGPAHAEEPCASAPELWKLAPEEAERIARACQQEAPDDVDRIAALAQVLAWRDAHDEALTWIDRGLALRPDAPELEALRLRVLGWQGRFDEAAARADAIAPAAASEPEVVRAKADLAYWRGDHGAAVEAYDAWLAQSPDDTGARRSRAIALAELGREEAARAELGALCAAGDESACGLVAGLGRRTWTLFAQAGPVADDGEAGWIGRALLDAQVSERVLLGGSFEVQQRSFGGEAVRDPILGLHGAWRAADRLVLLAGAGAAIDPTFSPLWNAHVEAGFDAGAGFSFFLRYWHLEFRGAGVEVLSPAIAWETRRLSLVLRAWRGFEEGRDPGLAVLGRATWAFHDDFELTAGVGGGDRADYLVLRDDGVESHFLLLAGVGWNAARDWQIRADWVGREESAGTQEFRRDEILFGVRRQW